MLNNLLPERLKKSERIAEIQNAINFEFLNLVKNYDLMLSRLFVASSDDMGLSLWEKIYGITADSTEDEFRRTRIMSKLRGNGTTTVEMIKNICKSFYNGEIEIEEDFTNDCFYVKFANKTGIPPNINDMSAAIDELKPAHLTYDYIIVYNMYSDFSRFTHSELAKFRHIEIREKESVRDGGNS